MVDRLPLSITLYFVTKADPETTGRGEGDGETQGGPPAGTEGSRGRGYGSNKVTRDRAWLLEEKKDLTLRNQSSIFDENPTGVTSSKAASASLQDNPSTTTTTDVEQNAEQDSASSTFQIRLEQGGDEVTSSQEKSSPPSDSDVLGVTVSASLSSDGTRGIASETQDLAASSFITASASERVIKESCDNPDSKAVTELPDENTRARRVAQQLPELTKPEELLSFFEACTNRKQKQHQDAAAIVERASSYNGDGPGFRLKRDHFDGASDLRQCTELPRVFAANKQKKAQTTSTTMPSQELSRNQQASTSTRTLEEGLLDEFECFLSAREVCLMGQGLFGGVWSLSEKGSQCDAVPESGIAVKHQLNGSPMVEACFALYVSRQENLAQYVAQAHEAVGFFRQACSGESPRFFLVMDKYSRSLQDQILVDKADAQTRGCSPLKAGISLRNSAKKQPLGQTSSMASERPLEEPTAGSVVVERFIKRGQHMIEGIVELGRLGIASRDIKLENYLVDDKALESPRLADWGLSTASGHYTAEQPLVGSPLFLDPLASLLSYANYDDWTSKGLRDEACAKPTYIQMDAWGLGDALLELWTSLEARVEIIQPSYARFGPLGRDWKETLSSRSISGDTLTTYAKVVEEECEKHLHPAIRKYYLEQTQSGGARTSTVFTRTVLELLLRYPLNCTPDKRDMEEFAELWQELLVDQMETSQEDRGNLGNEVVNENELKISQDATKDEVKGTLRKAAGLTDTSQAPGASSTFSETLSASTSRRSTSSGSDGASSSASTLQETPSTPSAPEGTPSLPSTSQQAAESSSPKGKPDGAAGPGDEGHKAYQATPTGGSGTRHGGDVPPEVMEVTEVTPGVTQSSETSSQHQVAASSWSQEALQAAASETPTGHEQLAGAGTDVGLNFDAAGPMATDITAKGAGGTMSSMGSAVQSGLSDENARDAMGGAVDARTSATTSGEEEGASTAASRERVEVGMKSTEGKASNLAGSERAGKKTVNQSKLLRREDR
ncbi:unnamed protein product [Amoebophrya sp. A25]|nr:unnamed protein product [Amoebophrya sp. A25]|eukprot:GSA25T00020403001.1